MNKEILIIGATGFVGANLLKSFIEKKIPVSVLARTPKKLEHISKEFVSVHQGDLTDIETLRAQVEKADIIYFLAHAMDKTEDFEELEKLQAQNICDLVNKDQRVIYLSGLGDDSSKHLRSRQLTGEILRGSKATVIELRASIIIGAGGISFEMIRAIVERFPLIINANWSDALCQPLALNDLIIYLIKAADFDIKTSQVIEIGGDEQIQYGELLKLYAKEKNLRRPQIIIRNLPKEVALKAIEVFIPEFYEVGKKLMGSIEIPTIVKTTHPIALSSHTPISSAISSAIDGSKKSWETITEKQFFSNAQFLSFQQQFAAEKIIDHVDLRLPIQKSNVIKAFEKLIIAFNLNPFKSFSLSKPEIQGDILSFKAQGKKLIELDIKTILKEDKDGTKVSLNFIYTPKSSIDSAAYSLFVSTIKNISEKFALLSQ